MSPAYDDGYKAYLDGKEYSDNPYWWCSAKSEKWRQGWKDAEAEEKKFSENTDKNTYKI